MKIYTIVVVENDPDERLFIEEAIKDSNTFSILTMVRNGNVLFEWLEDNPDNLPDLILSDLNMPGKNGFDILAEIKSNPLLSKIPVFITSTSSTPSIVERCLKSGASDYLIKPYTVLEYGEFFKDLNKKIADKLPNPSN